MCDFIWKKSFAGEIKLRILRWGDTPGLPRWALHPSVLVGERPTGDLRPEKTHEEEAVWPQRQRLE